MIVDVYKMCISNERMCVRSSVNLHFFINLATIFFLGGGVLAEDKHMLT